jgi:hypothetical protein
MWNELVWSLAKLGETGDLVMWRGALDVLNRLTLLNAAGS